MSKTPVTERRYGMTVRDEDGDADADELVHWSSRIMPPRDEDTRSIPDCLVELTIAELKILDRIHGTRADVTCLGCLTYRQWP